MALFERNKNIKADIIEEGLLKIEVSMMDNVHHISTTFHVSFPDREIRYAEAYFKRSPYLKVCRQTRKNMANIIGLKAYGGFAKKVTDALGGKNGCPHLVDQSLEMAKSLAQFISKSYDFPIEDYIDDASLLRKTILESYPMIGDMCWAYNVRNDHLFTKDVRCGLQTDLVI